jgi:hypothetical protein
MTTPSLANRPPDSAGASVCPPGPCPRRRCTCLARELAAVIRSAGPLAERRAVWYLASVQRREASGRKPIPMPGDDPRWWQDHFATPIRWAESRGSALAEAFQ